MDKIMPLLDGWQWEPKDIDEITKMDPKKVVAIEKFTKPGWVWSATASFSNDEAEIMITYDGELKMTISPKGVYGMGLDSPNPFGIFCPRYSEGPPPVYSIAYLPVNPMPFRREVVIAVRNPTESEVLMYNYAHVILIIDKTKLYRDSLKKLITTPK